MKKKLLALLLATTMTFGMSMTVLADEQPNNAAKQYEQDKTDRGYDGSIEGHSFVAYQVFKGVYAEGTLSDIEWGDGVDSEGIITALKDKNYLEKDITYSAAKVAEVIAEYGDYSDAAYDIASIVYANLNGTYHSVESKVDPGYYLVVDNTNMDAEDKKGDTRNLALLQVTNGTFDIKVKNSTVSVEKKVQDMNDSDATESANEKWQDSADYDIGDVIPFQLTGTIPSNYEQYKSFAYTFHDTEEEGLEFVGITKVYAVKDNDEKDLSGKYEITTSTCGCTFEVRFANLKEIEEIEAGYKIVVEYESKITEKAKIGDQGNINTVELEYTNSFDGNGTGKTKPDSVIVFTYELDVNKVTGTIENHTALAGAGFTLYKKYNSEPEGIESMNSEIFEKVKAATEITDNNYYKVGEMTSTEQNPIDQFIFEGLDDGEYILVETQTPVGYNTCTPIVFAVKAEHQDSVDVTEGNRTTVLRNLNITSESTITNHNGIMSTDVYNNKGSLLPSTGGMGTTIFYILGGILAVGAGVVLFARKRMSNEEE